MSFPAGRRSRLLRTHLGRLSRALHGVENGDVRSLHRARVASRRLREMVPLLQLDAETARKLGRRLRKITTRLGAVRELDVLLLLIDELHVSRRAPAGALARVGVAVSRDRDLARQRLFEKLPVDEMRRIVRKMRGIGEAIGGETARDARAVRWALDARVARRAGRLADALREAGTVYLPERLHAARIAVKKLRYVLELDRDVADVECAADLRALRRAQDALGRMHDLQVLIDRVRQVQASLMPPNVGVWRALDEVVALVDADCRRLHARYVRLRPLLESIAERWGRSAGSGFRAAGSRASLSGSGRAAR